MAEPRRVQLTTISGNVSPSAAPDPTLIPKPAVQTSAAAPVTVEGGTSGQTGHTAYPPKPTGDPPKPTVRFILTLFESDDRRCSEFWYPELANKQISVPDKEPGLPSCLAEDDGDHDELQAMARKFEEKYGGGGGGGGKKKRDRIQDLVDIGHGYDDEDSFIDNSEAYDEFVPSSLTTQHGGFYVNSGTLQFRQNSDTETGDDFSTEKTMKKRKLKEGAEEKPRKKKKRRNEESGQMMMRKKERAESGQIKSSEESNTGVTPGREKVMMKKKKKKPAGPLSVTDMLRKFRKQKEREKEQMRREYSERLDHTQGVGPSISGLPRMPLGPADAAGGGLGLADPLLSLIDLTNDSALLQATSTVDFLVDLDSLLDTTTENPQSQEAIPDPSTHVQGQAPKLLTQSQTGPVTVAKAKCLPMAIPQNQAQNQPQLQTSSLIVSDADLQPQTPPTAVPVAKTHFQAQPSSIPQNLPHPQQPLLENIPPALGRRITHLALAAQGFAGESKVKFFTPEVNSILLDIEQRSRDLGAQVRSRVYTHLASFLPCSRETLLKRAKKLLQAQEEPLQRLSEAIIRAMPEQVSRYHDDCQAHAQARVAKVAEEEKERGQKEEGKEREQQKEEGKENGGGTEEEGDDEEKSGKRVWAPRKTFRWSKEIRECLLSVVRVKMERYQVERDQDQDQDQMTDEHLKTFLNNQVKPLWPKGWMQPRVLLKESRRVLSEGSHTVKRKMKTEKRWSSLGRAPTPPDISTRPVDPQAFFEALPPNEAHPPGSGVPPPSLGLDTSLDESLSHTAPSLSVVGEELASLSRGEERERREGGGDYSSSMVEDTLSGAATLACVAVAVAEPHPSLSLLVEQALARDKLSQKLLAVATADLSPQQRGQGLGLHSPPLPPPPPQSSPVLPHFLHGLSHNGSLLLGDGPSSQRKLH